METIFSPGEMTYIYDPPFLHQIITTVFSRLWNLAGKRLILAKRDLDGLLVRGVIRPPSSQWTSHMVGKRQLACQSLLVFLAMPPGLYNADQMVQHILNHLPELPFPLSTRVIFSCSPRAPSTTSSAAPRYTLCIKAPTQLG